VAASRRLSTAQCSAGRLCGAAGGMVQALLQQQGSGTPIQQQGSGTPQSRWNGGALRTCHHARLCQRVRQREDDLAHLQAAAMQRGPWATVS